MTSRLPVRYRIRVDRIHSGLSRISLLSPEQSYARVLGLALQLRELSVSFEDPAIVADILRDS
ncbi:MAG TPA: hypothetical protein VKP30_22670 [Polyangiaceae bacterium]|nr:hypothetical protein [Polyangiaceae bacterium]